MPPDREKPQATGEDAIASRLARLARRTPALADLIAALPPTLVPDAAWWARYHAQQSADGAAWTLAGVLFGSGVTFKCADLPLDARTLATWVSYFEYHPHKPNSATNNVPAHVVPNAIARRFAADGKCSVHAFLGRAFVGPYLAARAGEPLPAPYDNLPREALQLLVPFYAARLLTAEHARTLATTRVTSHQLDWYFATSRPLLDLRNLLVYLGVALDDRQGGRVQNKLPLHFARRFGVNLRSVPETLATLDVLALALDGILDVTAIDDDWLGFAALLAAPTVDVDALRAVLEPHRRRFVIDDAMAAELVDAGGWHRGGQFDNGLLFNVPRLCGWVPGRTARLARFSPYYRAVADHRLREALVAHAADPPRYEQRLAALAARCPDLFVGIRARDTLNILAVVDEAEARGIAASHALPAVAQWALGVPEPCLSARANVAPTRRARVVAVAPRAIALPELDRLRVGCAYVLHPDWRDALPHGAPIFVPRAIAAGFETPPGVELSGPARLPWGTNPYAPELNPEWALFALTHLDARVASSHHQSTASSLATTPATAR